MFLAEDDVDDSVSAYTDSVGSIESLDDFELDDFGDDQSKQYQKAN